MKIMLRINLIAFVFLCAGCATFPDTTSVNPEITVTNVKFDCVRSIFMNSYMNKGYTIRDVSNTQIVAGRTANNAPFLYHSFYGGAPEERVTITFFPADTPDALRIVATAAYVSNPATANEKVYPSQGTQEDQDLLMSMQSVIENRCRK